MYACAYCGRAAPPLDDAGILEWAGGSALYGSTEPIELPPDSLVCPDCRGDEREREEGGGD